jgi:VCBS repeat-containing protein
VLGNDSDVDSGQTLSAAKVSDPSHGTLTLRANGSYDYSPAADYNGPDSFTYKASDGHGGESTATKVSLTVAAAPVATPTPTPTASATPTPTPTTTPPPDDSAAKAQQRLTALAAKLGKAAVASAGKFDAKKATLALGTAGAADCPAGCTITLGLAKGAKKIGTATLTLSPGGTAAVKLKLNAAGKKLLKKGKPVKATLTMTLRDTATGTTKTVTQPLTLKPKKKK